MASLFRLSEISNKFYFVYVSFYSEAGINANMNAVCNIISIYAHIKMQVNKQINTANSRRVLWEYVFLLSVILKAVQIVTRWFCFSKTQVTMIIMSSRFIFYFRRWCNQYLQILLKHSYWELFQLSLAISYATSSSH